MLVNRLSNRGSITLPIVIGMGLMMTSVGAMMLTLSQAERVDALSHKANTSSESAAESGISHYLNFINNYRQIARFSACNNPQSPTKWNQNGTCQVDEGIDSWANEAATGDLMDEEANFCLNSSRIAQEIEEQAHQNWQSVEDENEDGNSDSGEYFRLVDYEYQREGVDGNGNETGTATLTVEGRAQATRQQEVSAAEAAGTGTTRLQVTVPIDSSLDGEPGLWVRNDVTINGPETPTRIQTNLRYSMCPRRHEDSLGALNYIFEPFTHRNTPGVEFPELPDLPPGIPPTSGNRSELPMISLPPSSTIRREVTLGECQENTSCWGGDQASEPPEGEPYRYYIPPSNQGQRQPTLYLRNGTLTVNAPGKTVELYVDGGISLVNGKIEVTPDTTLIIYLLRGGLSLSGQAKLSIEPDGTENLETHRIQIYNYATIDNAATNISLASQSRLDGFIFAPEVTVNLSGDATVRGTIWASRFIGGGTTQLLEDRGLDFEKLLVERKPVNQLGNESGTISSWQRLGTAEGGL